MAGNASFDGLVAFASEKQIKRDWSMIWSVDHPFLKKIQSDAMNYNTATEDQLGNSMLLPLNYLGPTTSARIGTNANAYTAVTPHATVGFTQAQYFYARFEAGLYLTPTEQKQIAKAAGGTTRIPILPGKIGQMTQDLKNIETTEFFGTQNGTGATGTGSVTGLRYFASTSNSPGGVSQTTYSTWAASVNSSAGALTEALFDGEIHRIGALGRGMADYMQLSYASTNDVYGKFIGLFSGSQLIVDQGKSVKYGFQVFNYRGLDVFMDNGLGSAGAGSLCIGRSGAWYVSQKSEEPVMQDDVRLPGTGSREYWFDHELTWGCDDVASLSYLSGVA